MYAVTACSEFYDVDLTTAGLVLSFMLLCLECFTMTIIIMVFLYFLPQNPQK